jgi:hypothetical protein
LPWIGPIPVFEGPDDNNNYKVEFSPMMFSFHSWVARSELKLYLFPQKSMYSSKYFTRSGPIEVEAEEVWVVEKIGMIGSKINNTYS